MSQKIDYKYPVHVDSAINYLNRLTTPKAERKPICCLSILARRVFGDEWKAVKGFSHQDDWLMEKCRELEIEMDTEDAND